MFDITTNVSFILILIEGIISFFSPCILPILPLYFSYLSGNAKTKKDDGTIEYQRGKVLIYTLSFVLGISCAFFLLGLSVFAFGHFFETQKNILIRIGGLLIIFMGFLQLGFFHIPFFQKEWRLPTKLNGKHVNLMMAFIMGFTFSFAWTPCVGPALSSVLIMAGNAQTMVLGILYIVLYTLGFILPFLGIGLFTTTILNLLKKHQSSLQVLIQVGGVLLVIIGFLMFAGVFYEEKPSAYTTPVTEEKTTAIDFQLMDINGKEVQLSDYKGRTIYLSFWATWCPYCKQEISDLNDVYQKYGENQKDVIILSIVMPSGKELDEAGIRDFVKEQQVLYPVLLDKEGDAFYSYAVSSLPMTYLINSDFKIQGYIKGKIDMANMEIIIEQTQAEK